MIKKGNIREIRVKIDYNEGKIIIKTRFSSKLRCQILGGTNSPGPPPRSGFDLFFHLSLITYPWSKCLFTEKYDRLTEEHCVSTVSVLSAFCNLLFYLLQQSFLEVTTTELAGQCTAKFFPFLTILLLLLTTQRFTQKVISNYFKINNTL